MSKIDYYESLDLKKGASDSDIKKAYRKLVKIHHPDKGGSEEKFKEISEAYECLSDPDKKAKYDQFGHNSGSRQRASAQDYGFQPSLRKGPNMTLTVKLTLEEVHTGARKTYKYKRDTNCVECNGHGGTNISNCDMCGGGGMVLDIINTPVGQFRSARTCPRCEGIGTQAADICKTCSGRGVNSVDESIEMAIPFGVEDGMAFMMSEKGNSIKNGIPGDVVVKIMVLPHKTFVRNGDDLKINAKLNYSQLVLGDKIEIDTIEGGRIRITVPEFSKVGTNLRIPNKGLNGFNKTTRGELIITLEIEIPSTITDEQRELISALKNL